jgi:hypothetical protein
MVKVIHTMTTLLTVVILGVSASVPLTMDNFPTTYPGGEQCLLANTMTYENNTSLVR